MIMAADGQHHIDALNRAGGRARQCEHLSYARDRFCAMLPPGAEIFVGRHSTVPQEDLKNFSMRSLKKNIRRNQFKVLAYWDGAPCAIATIPAIHDRCVAAHHQSPSRVLLLLLFPPPPLSPISHTPQTHAHFCRAGGGNDIRGKFYFARLHHGNMVPIDGTTLNLTMTTWRGKGFFVKVSRVLFEFCFAQQHTSPQHLSNTDVRERSRIVGQSGRGAWLAIDHEYLRGGYGRSGRSSGRRGVPAERPLLRQQNVSHLFRRHVAVRYGIAPHKTPGLRASLSRDMYRYVAWVRTP